MIKIFANEAEKLFSGFLEQKGFQRGKNYWYEDEMFESGNLEKNLTVPDFYIKADQFELLVELKELRPTKIVRNQKFAAVITQEKVQKIMKTAVDKAKDQLENYSTLKIPMMIVIFDSSYDYIHDKWDIQNVFGIHQYVFSSSDKTGYARMQRKGHQIGPERGLYISAVAALFSTFPNASLAIQHNPFAHITMPEFFTSAFERGL